MTDSKTAKPASGSGGGAPNGPKPDADVDPQQQWQQLMEAMQKTNGGMGLANPYMPGALPFGMAFPQAYMGVLPYLPFSSLPAMYNHSTQAMAGMAGGLEAQARADGASGDPQDVEEGEGSSDVEGEDAPSVNTDNTDNDGGKRQRGPSTAGAANSKRQRSEGNVMSNSSEALAMLAHAAAEPKKPGQQKQQKQQQKQQQQQANQMMTEMWNAQAAAAAAVAAAGGLGVGLADLGSGEVEGALPEDINIEGLDDKDLKRLRRKQSNRESARRSRLRKQAECETLQRENKDLKAQLQQLREENMKLNAQLELLNVKFSMTNAFGSLQQATYAAVALPDTNGNSGVAPPAAANAGQIKADSEATE